MQMHAKMLTVLYWGRVNVAQLSLVSLSFSSLNNIRGFEYGDATFSTIKVIYFLNVLTVSLSHILT